MDSDELYQINLPRVVTYIRSDYLEWYKKVDYLSYRKDYITRFNCILLAITFVI